MSNNIASLTCARQIGLSSYSRQRYGQSKWKFGATKVFVNDFNEQYMKDIYCLNNQKYLVPGELESEVPPYAVQFSTAPGNERTFAVADENGIVSLFSAGENQPANGGENALAPMYKLQAHKNAIFDIAWIPHENSLATASGDQTAALWDMVKGEVTTVFKGHSCSLKSINVSKHNTNLLVTGSRDGNALVWDQRSPSQSVVRIQDAHVIKDCLTPMRRKRRIMSTVDSGQLGIDSRQTVSSAIFQDSNTVITSGAMDGMLKIWDLRKIHHQPKRSSAKSAKKDMPVETIPYPGVSQRRRGYTCLTLDSSHTQLYASCTDDSIYHYNLSTSAYDYNKRQPICRYKGHYNTSFYVRTSLSPDNQFLLSGSDDSKAYIWNANGTRKSPILRLISEGMSEVTAVAWCPYDYTKLVTCSDECVVRIWNLPYNGQENLKDCDIDGRAQFLPERKKNTVDVVTNPTFTPKLVVRIDPFQESTSPRATKLTNVFQTPQKSNDISSPSTSTTKKYTPLRSISNVVTKTPTSIEKWLVRTPTQKKHHCGAENSNPFSKSRAVKCLEDHMTSIEEDGKENALFGSNFCTKDSEIQLLKGAENKNWLKEMSKRRRSKEPDDSPVRKKQKPIQSSPLCCAKISSSNKEKTLIKSAKTLESYFSTAS